MPDKKKDELTLAANTATPESKETGSADELEKVPPVSVLSLFKFADKIDVLLMFGGAFGAMIVGGALPLFSVLLGGLFDDFASPNPDDVEAAGAKYAKLFGLIAIGVAVCGALQMGCFTLTSERQTLRVRKMYLDAILKQEVAFFDKGSGQLSSSIAENTVVIRDAMGEKLGMLFQFMTMFIAGFAVGFSINWKLTLVVVAVTPLLAVGAAMMMKTMADATAGGLGAYARAGAVAEETFTMIRTVVSFGLEKRLSSKYRDELEEAESQGIRKSKAQGIGMAMTMGTYFLTYALAFWVGSRLVLDSKDSAAELFPPNTLLDSRCKVGTVITPADAINLTCITLSYSENFVFETAADVCNCFKCACGCLVTDSCVSGGDIVLVFFSVVIAAFSLGQAAPSITALNNGRAAAARIYAILDRKPAMDSSGSDGVIRDQLEGDIELENVTFRYPTRPDTPIFQDLSLRIRSGESTALVGGSGSGKSTITQLVQRFYDPEAGFVRIGGTDIKELNLRWLRQQMALVSQEPILFATTIAGNIAYGSVEGHDPSREEIEAAAKAANAYDFIMEFPDGFDTFVGEGGSSLSGGQKQRIAIARAMIRDPSILILDEATSALDNESERIVQAALDDLLKQKARTTIVIAHRLTTVRNCDKIVVLGEGKLLEEGTHDQLVQKKGFYNALLTAANKTRKERRSKRKSKKAREVDSASSEDEVDEEDDTIEKRSSTGSSRSGDDQVESILRRQSKRISEKGLDPVPASFVDLEAATVSDRKSGTSGDQSSDSGMSKSSKKSKEETYSVPMRRVFVFSAPEKKLYIPGLIAAAVNGAQLPIFSILFAGIASTYYMPTADLIQKEANKYALYFVAFSVIGACSNMVAFYVFGIIGERMTTRVRYFLFKALLRQDIGFYDLKENSVGALTSRLATDAALVKASLADRLNLIVMNLATVIAGLVIAFYYGWKLTLILIGLVPLLALSGMLQLWVVTGLAKADDKALAEAGQVLSESIHGIRTVTAFALRKKVVGLYQKALEKPSKLATRKGIFGGAGFGFSQGMIFGVYAIAFHQGARLIADPTEDYDLQKVLNVFFAVVMLGVGIGQSAAMAPDVAKAGVAISNVFKVIDRQSPIDPSTEDGLKDDAIVSKNIEFKNVSFSYPSRPDAKVFDDFTLTIEGGTTVALVGQSGSGKSTAISLLERFYDPSEGEVHLQGIPIKEANVAWLRASKLGLVQQEPNLFAGTVFENIAYGVSDSGLDRAGGLVTEEQVIAAAKAANAHEFIMALPDGYQTVISSSTLSGGQKQRVAIARCLIRDPEILLLDEATAALDNESEAIVQRALDDIMASRTKTVIVVAHRLSTIKNADKICVVHHGQIIEQGTYAELLSNSSSAFSKLQRAQNKR